MSKFKVGDTVKRITKRNAGEFPCHWVFSVGDTARVTRVNGEWYALEGYGDPEPQHHEEYLELVEKPKFKVGDRIRVKPGDHAPYYASGDVGTVLQVGQYDVYVRFSGHHNAAIYGDGHWYVSNDNAEVLQPRYASTFTEPAKAEPTTGHAAEGGLQKHSLGELYPLAIVGYGLEPMVYTLENLETGQVACCADTGEVRQWLKPSLAKRFALELDLKNHPGASDSFGEGVEWKAGRPVSSDGRLVMPALKREILYTL